jgi:hypothetical protein
MKYRKLRIAWSVGWGVVAVLLCVLWVRSYWWQDVITGRYGAALSTHGSLTLDFWGSNPLFPNAISSIEQGVLDASELVSTLYRFQFQFDGNGLLTTLPIWTLVIASAICGFCPWTFHRFSLRTMLIATTLVAAVLGMIAWAVR